MHPGASNREAEARTLIEIAGACARPTYFANHFLAAIHAQDGSGLRNRTGQCMSGLITFLTFWQHPCLWSRRRPPVARLTQGNPRNRGLGVPHVCRPSLFSRHPKSQWLL
jgi:hypothetical protein